MTRENLAIILLAFAILLAVTGSAYAPALWAVTCLWAAVLTVWAGCRMGGVQ